MTPDDLDRLEALIEAYIAVDREGLLECVRSREDADYIAALSPDVVRQLIAAARLGAAWQAAEAALPEGIQRAISIGQYPADVESAGDWTALVVWAPEFYGNGPTPAAALLSLAEALRGRK